MKLVAAAVAANDYKQGDYVMTYTIHKQHSWF